VCSELTAPSGVASPSPIYVLFWETGGRLGKDSGDIADECKEGTRETSDAVVCPDERPDFKGEDEGAGHSGSE